MSWRTKTTNGDLCKYKVYELMGTGRKGDQRSFVVRAYILTDNPMGYTNNPIVLRVFKGKALICIEEMHTAESWLLIGYAVGRMMENKNNDK